jgi:hypothetical protein
MQKNRYLLSDKPFMTRTERSLSKAEAVLATICIEKN